VQLFHKPFGVVLNKCFEGENPAEQFCLEHQLPIVGRIPFDREAVRAINDGETIVDRDCAAGAAVKEIFVKTMELFQVIAQS